MMSVDCRLSFSIFPFLVTIPKANDLISSGGGEGMGGFAPWTRDGYMATYLMGQFSVQARP